MDTLRKHKPTGVKRSTTNAISVADLTKQVVANTPHAVTVHSCIPGRKFVPITVTELPVYPSWGTTVVTDGSLTTVRAAGLLLMTKPGG